jgi:riboflavin synthase
VDGCSLTVGQVRGDTFNVWLIPETLRVTTLGQRAQGERLNIELDASTVAIVDTVEAVLAARDYSGSRG